MNSLMAHPDWQSSNAGSELHNPTSWNWMKPLSHWATAVPGTVASKDRIPPFRPQTRGSSKSLAEHQGEPADHVIKHLRLFSSSKLIYFHLSGPNRTLTERKHSGGFMNKLVKVGADGRTAKGCAALCICCSRGTRMQ